MISLNITIISIAVLSRRHCEENMKIAAKNNLFLDNLHRVAFCYSNGPFKSLLVRLGYDVKNDPKTRYFQTVTMKFSSRLLNAVYRRCVYFNSSIVTVDHFLK
jgi:hypothetical protein